MTPDPESLAKLHADCFSFPRPWKAAEFAEFLTDPKVTFIGDDAGFALLRVVADEAEILTIAVAASDRRMGKGRKLLADLMNHAQLNGATTCFLEVAENNNAAIGLYRDAGFAESGRRTGYYRPDVGPRVNALVFSKRLPAT